MNINGVCQLWAINIAIETDRFRSIVTTLVAAAEKRAIKIAVNDNAHDEIETDRFRSILTT